MSISPCPKWYWVDALRIRQVLVNLISNAIKFTQKGEIVIHVEARPRRAASGPNPSGLELHFTVRDTGIGISREKHQTIFHAFSQADNSTTRQYGGTGLGLTISKRLVEMMGGLIWLDSEPQKGSKFTFTTPVGVVEGPPGLLELDCASLRGVPVLVVDDNAANLHLLADWLSHWGMRPLLAASAPAAIKILDSSGHGISLVLTDINMPETSGFELLDHIKRTTQLPTVIMLSSGSYASDVERSRELGAEAYLIKPVRRTELLQTILRVVKTNTLVTNSESTWRGSVQKLGMEIGSRSTCALQILVAEDNTINQKYAVRLLENEGYGVVVVGNGQEAVAALEREPFHAVLMDVQMPVMDGFEATNAIRAREIFTGIRTPIIAMTAHAMGGDRDKCLAAGMDGYVSKPIRRLDLLETIASLTVNSKIDVLCG